MRCIVCDEEIGDREMCEYCENLKNVEDMMVLQEDDGEI